MTPIQLLAEAIHDQRMTQAQLFLNELNHSLSTLSPAERGQVLAELTFLAGGRKKPVRAA